MPEPTPSALPKFFKDSEGFCYIATPSLAVLPGMEPWDGLVDARGFATETAVSPVTPARSRSRTRRDASGA